MTSKVSRSEHAVWKKRTLTTIWASCDRLPIMLRRRWIFSLTCLMRRLSSACRREKEESQEELGERERRRGLNGCRGKRGQTHLAQDVIDVAVMLGEALGELVVLLGERPDVDAAERVGLREGEGEREPGSAMARRQRRLDAKDYEGWREREEGGGRTA